MPFKNFHSARLKDPDQYDRFAYEADKLGDGIDVVFGIKAGKSEIQAIRFDKTKFSTARAKAWLKDHDKKAILFEPASEATTTSGDIAVFAKRFGKPEKRKKKKNNITEKIENLLRKEQNEI